MPREIEGAGLRDVVAPGHRGARRHGGGRRRDTARTTALLLAGVKTSGIGNRAVARGNFDTTLVLVGCRGVQPVVDAGPLRIAAIEFVIVEFTCVRPPPRFGGEAPQHARPAAPGVLVAVWMQTGERVGDGAPRTDKFGFGKLFEERGEGAAKLAACAAQRGGNDDVGALAFVAARFRDVCQARNPSADPRGNNLRNLPREQRRHRVADLLVLLGARPLEAVIVGERLQPRGFAHAEAAALRRVVVDEK